MKHIKSFLLTAIISFSIFTTNCEAEESDAITDNTTTVTAIPQFADIIEELLPAVVNISTTQNFGSSSNIEKLLENLPKGYFSDRLKDFLESDDIKNKEIFALGSGFIISKDGYVITNYHVIEDADEIMVSLNDSKKLKAKVIGFDKKTDLALLKIDAKKDLKYVKLSSKNSRIGEWVIAIGNPFGLGGSVSVGIISADGRNISSGKFDDFIQTDAAINKGNSGGPLFNIKGEVIGIATAIFSPSGGNVGIGFATPTRVAIPVIDQLKSKGEVIRGWLGVSIHGINDKVAEALGMKEAKGAFVVDILENSPAEKAGILPTDIITEFDGQEINEVKDLPDVVSKTPIGKKVKISVFRNGKIKVLNTKVQKLEETKKKDEEKDDIEAAAYLSGMSLVDLNKEIKRKYSIDGNIEGVFIAKVKPGHETAKKGVKAGDIILSINQTKVTSISSLAKTIKKAKKDKRKDLMIFIQRGDLKSAVLIPIEDVKIISKTSLKKRFKVR